jgi:hypothetical protein
VGAWVNRGRATSRARPPIWALALTGLCGVGVLLGVRWRAESSKARPAEPLGLVAPALIDSQGENAGVLPARRLIDSQGENAGVLPARRLLDSQGENAGVLSATRKVAALPGTPSEVDARVAPPVGAVESLARRSSDNAPLSAVTKEKPHAHAASAPSPPVAALADPKSPPFATDSATPRTYKPLEPLHLELPAVAAPPADPCDPPYTVDAEKRRVYKPECLVR